MVFLQVSSSRVKFSVISLSYINVCVIPFISTDTSIEKWQNKQR